MREGLELTGVEVARAIGWSQPKLSRVETGRFFPSLSELGILLDYYGVTEDVRAELLARVASRDGVQGAWVVRAGGPRARHASLSAVESRAARLRQFQSAVIPGLLQTPAYARAVAASGGYPDVDGIVRRRVSRQTEYLGNGAQFDVVLSEAVIRASPASPQVMDEQLQQLLSPAAGVSVQVLPLAHGLPVAPLGSFLCFEFGRGRPSVVLIESQTADVYLSSPGDVAAYEALFASLSEAALSVEESTSLIAQCRREVRRRSTKKG